MGTIQNSVNQMLGTAAGAVTLSKHIKQQNEQIKAVEEGIDVSKATAKMDALQKSLEFEEKGQALQTEKDQTISALNENVDEAHMLNKQVISGRNSKGQFMSKKALQEAADRVTELKDQRFRLEQQLGYVGNKIDLHKELGNAMVEVFNKTLKGGKD